jgi:hypothetical protein
MAQSFLRTRYGVGDRGDLSRISNQQVFMSALFRKIQTDGVLRNPVKLYSLASAAIANINPSDTLNPVTLVSTALALKGVGSANTVFLQYPAGRVRQTPLIRHLNLPLLHAHDSTWRSGSLVGRVALELGAGGSGRLQPSVERGFDRVHRDGNGLASGAARCVGAGHIEGALTRL